MHINVKILFFAIVFACLPSLASDNFDRSMRLEGFLPPLEVKLPKEAPVIHGELNIGISPHALVSCLGLVASVLGTLLIYDGIKKMAAVSDGSSERNAIMQNVTTLHRYGAAMVACGLIAVCHKQIANVFIPTKK